MQHFNTFNEAMEHQNHAALVERHAIKRLFDELNPDQLASLRSLLEVCMQGTEGNQAATGYHGMTVMILEKKFGVCWACRENPCVAEHGLENMLARDDLRCPTCGSTDPRMHPAVSGGGEVTDMCADSFHQGYPKKVEVHPDAIREMDPMADLPLGGTGMLSPSQISQMVEYHLDDLREEGTNKLVGFICLECGYQYPSIEDRMIRPPGIDNCPGCINKTKFG